MRYVRPATAVAAGILGLAVTATPVNADDNTSTEPNGFRMQLVLDSSGSMAEPANDGTKIEVAKQALDTVIDGLPDDAQVGLRVYGATISSGPKACTDSQEIVQPGTDNRDELHAAIDDYKPLGETPIGYALQEAAKDLGTEGNRTIVLVSDGEATCKPNPCKVARRLSKDGIDLRIDVVGLSVDRRTRKQLTCIADAGNGTYYDANDAESLTNSIDTLSTRAFRPFNLTGKPVDGSKKPKRAPTLESGVQYLDELPEMGDVQYYRIDRTVPGSTIHVGTAARTPVGSTGASYLTDLYAENSDAWCGSAGSYGNGVGSDQALLTSIMNTSQPVDDAACAKADFFTLAIELSMDEELGDTAFELVPFEEPPLAKGADKDLPPAADTEPAWTKMGPGPATDGVVPGTGLANAPVLEDGTYALDIQSGETQVFAVPLDWGQRLQVQIDADLSEEAIEAAGSWSGFETTIFGPLRGAADASIDDPELWTNKVMMGMSPGGHWRTGATTPTVRYRNRESDYAGMKATAFPGFRYVQVNLSLYEQGVSVPYELTVKRFGEDGEGAPEYAATDELAAPEADSAITAIGEAVEPGEAAGSNTDSDADAETNSESAPDTDPVAAETDGGFPMTAALLGGTGALVLAGGVAAVALARRPR